MNVKQQIQESVKDLDDYNKMLGRTSMQPFKPANSGSRALMNSVHVEHLMIPYEGEVPIIQTGAENQFGENSSSFIRSNSDYKVIAKVHKYNFADYVKDDLHYFLIIQDMKTGIYDVIERVTYKHNTESYGFLWDNSRLDTLRPGDTIKTNQIVKTSTGFDDCGNKMNGVNLLTVYLSCAQNMEDSIIISETAAKKLAVPLVKSTSITINDNDALCDLYGDGTVYKTFPDVGEEIKNGVFCSLRRIENDNILYSLSQQKLREPMISDRNILMNGIVADIDVYCNNPESLGDSHYNQQLYYYYNQKMEFCRQINNIVAPLAMNGQLSYNLQVLYATCRDIIAGRQFFKDKQFSNIIMEVTVIEKLPMEPGDKMCDRYGGKGVVSEIRPDYLMPKLSNGKVVEVIKNQSTCINRENVGQLHEQSLSFIGMKIIDYFKSGVLDASDMCLMWYKFVNLIDPTLALWASRGIDFYDEYQAQYFIDSILEDDAIILSLEPFSTKINQDTIAAIYKEFPWIKPYEVEVPMENSNGEIRYVNTNRPLICAKIYNYRLKQYAEEKFSVTSLSATNLKGLNAKSKANKVYEAKYTKTPVMFGAMESGNLAHLGMQYVVMNLMLYSTSPQARRLFEQLLTGDPYNIDIRLDKDSKNRNAEIINALFKSMGLELVFEKVPKVKKVLVMNVMVKTINKLRNKQYFTNIRDFLPSDDLMKLDYEIAKKEPGKKMVGRVMCKVVDPNEGSNSDN